MPEIASIEERPLLTIAIPTYNRSAFLSELLDCLLPQLLAEPRVELLISDNASPDDTLQLLRILSHPGSCLPPAGQLNQYRCGRQLSPMLQSGRRRLRLGYSVTMRLFCPTPFTHSPLSSISAPAISSISPDSASPATIKLLQKLFCTIVSDDSPRMLSIHLTSSIK